VSLVKLSKKRCPLDENRVFVSMGNLNSLLRVMSHYSDECVWPSDVNKIDVPVFVRMVRYKAGESRLVPDGMRWGPMVRVGSVESHEINMCGYHYAAGIATDMGLDGCDAGDNHKWLFDAVDHPFNTLCEDAGIYRCDICNEHVYRDDFGLRFNRSATIFDGSLVCRDCEVHGLIAPRETREQMDRAHKLASFIGGDALASYLRGMEQYQQKTTGGGRPCQTRLYKEDMYSFGWSTLVQNDEGVWHRWIHGGFIKHGPNAEPAEGGDYNFTTWDYGQKCVRSATTEEINHIHWSSHT
jgi:hypothetical protein